MGGLIDLALKNRMNYLLKIKKDVMPLVKSLNVDKLWKKFLFIENSEKEGIEAVDDFFISARKKEYFSKFYDKIKRKKFSIYNLKNLDLYKSEVIDTDSFSQTLDMAVRSLDSKLASFVEPLKSLPYFYLNDHFNPNCQAITQVTGVLYSYENDVNDLLFAESFHTDRREYFLNLLKIHKDMDDNTFYMVHGENAVGAYNYADQFAFFKLLGNNSNQNYFTTMGTGKDIKNILLNTVLSLEEPHALVVNKNTNEEFDAYDDEKRKYVSYDLKQAIYVTTMLDVLFIKDALGFNKEAKAEYEKLKNFFPKDNYTLDYADSHFSFSDYDKNVAALEKVNSIFNTNNVDIPAKYIVKSIINDLNHNNIYNMGTLPIKRIKKNLDYLKKTYIIPNAIEVISHKYAFPGLVALEKFE